MQAVDGPHAGFPAVTDFLYDGPDPMEKPLLKAGPMEFGMWRRKWADIRIARTGEDGCQADWMGLLSEQGATKLDNAVIKVRQGKAKGGKIWYNDVLEALAVDPSHNSEPDPAEDAKAAKLARIDLLIWCLTHSPACYADACCHYKDGEPGAVSKRTYKVDGRSFEVRFQERLRIEPESRWTALRDMAEEARQELSTQTGIPLEAKWKTRLYETVKADRTLRAWLRIKRLIP